MLTHFRVQNYKMLGDIDVPLSRITVLVGPNGSGKTTFLEAIERFSNVWNEPYAAFLKNQFHPRRLINKRTGNRAIELEGIGTDDSDDNANLLLEIESFKSPRRQAKIRVVATDEGTPRFETSFNHYAPIEDETSETSSTLIEVVSRKSNSESGALHIATRGFSPAMLLRLDGSSISRPGLLDASPPRIGFDGGGTSSVLANMALTDPNAFQDVVESLKNVIPVVRAIRFTRENIDDSGSAGYRMVFDTVGGDDISASYVSEGTLLVLALMVTLAAPRPPRILLLDDIERGLHPKATKDLVSHLRTVLASNKVAPDNRNKPFSLFARPPTTRRSQVNARQPQWDRVNCKFNGSSRF